MQLILKIMRHLIFRFKVLLKGLKFLYRRAKSSGLIQSYFKNSSQIKINFGCGANILEGWLNCDYTPGPGVCYINCTKKLPFADGSTDYIYTEHMIEHLTFAEAACFLKECRRILKPSGKIRLATPDMEFFVDMYKGTKDSSKHLAWIKERNNLTIPASPVNCLNNITSGHGHKFVYDFDYLRALLEHCGFQNVARCDIHKSADPVFNGLEYHGTIVGQEINDLETLTVEADP